MVLGKIRTFNRPFCVASHFFSRLSPSRKRVLLFFFFASKPHSDFCWLGVLPCCPMGAFGEKSQGKRYFSRSKKGDFPKGCVRRQKGQEATVSTPFFFAQSFCTTRSSLENDYAVFWNHVGTRGGADNKSTNGRKRLVCHGPIVRIVAVSALNGKKSILCTDKSAHSPTAPSVKKT